MIGRKEERKVFFLLELGIIVYYLKGVLSIKLPIESSILNNNYNILVIMLVINNKSFLKKIVMTFYPIGDLNIFWQSHVIPRVRGYSLLCKEGFINTIMNRKFHIK